MAIELRQSTAQDVPIGPFIGSTGTPVTGVSLPNMDRAELVVYGSAATIDISGNTWVSVAGSDGINRITLTASDTATLGPGLLYFDDISEFLPVPVYVHIMTQNHWDSKYSESKFITAAAIQSSVWGATSRTITAPTAAQIQASVWGATSRTITAPTAAQIQASVWGAGTRTLTSGSESGASIATAVWDKQISLHTTAGTTGEALDGASAPTAAEIQASVWGAASRTLTSGSESAASIADAVWDEQISLHTTAGTTGEALDGASAPTAAEVTASVWGHTSRVLTGNDNLNDPTAAAIVASVWATATRTVTNTIPTAAEIQASVWGAGTRTLTSGIPTAAEIQASVWGAGTRTLTSGIPTAAEIQASVWGAGTRTLTSGIPTAAEIQASVWGATARTITAPTAAQIAASVWGTATKEITNDIPTAAEIQSSVWGNVFTEPASVSVITATGGNLLWALFSRFFHRVTQTSLAQTVYKSGDSDIFATMSVSDVAGTQTKDLAS